MLVLLVLVVKEEDEDDSICLPISLGMLLRMSLRLLLCCEAEATNLRCLLRPDDDADDGDLEEDFEDMRKTARPWQVAPPRESKSPATKMLRVRGSYVRNDTEAAFPFLFAPAAASKEEDEEDQDEAVDGAAGMAGKESSPVEAFQKAIPGWAMGASSMVSKRPPMKSVASSRSHAKARTLTSEKGSWWWWWCFRGPPSSSPPSSPLPLLLPLLLPLPLALARADTSASRAATKASTPLPRAREAAPAAGSRPKLAKMLL